MNHWKTATITLSVMLILTLILLFPTLAHAGANFSMTPQYNVEEDTYKLFEDVTLKATLEICIAVAVEGKGLAHFLPRRNLKEGERIRIMQNLLYWIRADDVVHIIPSRQINIEYPVDYNLTYEVIEEFLRQEGVENIIVHDEYFVPKEVYLGEKLTVVADEGLINGAYFRAFSKPIKVN